MQSCSSVGIPPMPQVVLIRHHSPDCCRHGLREEKGGTGQREKLYVVVLQADAVECFARIHDKRQHGDEEQDAKNPQCAAYRRFPEVAIKCEIPEDVREFAKPRSVLYNRPYVKWNIWQDPLAQKRPYGTGPGGSGGSGWACHSLPAARMSACEMAHKYK